MKRKKLLGLTALLLATALILGAGSLADTAPTEKSEVIYARLGTDGTAQGVYVVNSFELDQPGRITDYGSYEQVSSLTSLDPLSFDGESVTCAVSKAGRFSYQGNLADTSLPWTIEITYELDGTAVSAQQLAGQSGSLVLQINVSENEACTGPWFAEYALNITVTLDGDLCAHIQSEDGVVAASGGDSVITFTLLPGCGGSCSLSAQVTDFDMASIQFAGVPLGLSLDLESMDLSGVTEQLTDLTGGVGQLSEGATQLADGTNALNDGAQEILTGLQDLSEGSSALDTGLQTLSANSGDLTDGASQLAQGLSQLQDGFTQYETSMAQAGTSGAQLAQANTQAVQTLEDLTAQYADVLSLLAASEEYTDLVAGIDQVKTLLSANAQVLTAQDTLISGASSGLEQLTGGAQSLSTGVSQYTAGVTSAAAGSQQLAQGTAQAAAGFETFAQGVTELSDGAQELADGVEQLKDGTDSLDDPETLQDLADGLLDSYLGSDSEPVSFVSSRNTQVTAVQFVFLSQGIHAEAAEETVAQEEPEPTFWDRLRELF